MTNHVEAAVLPLKSEAVERAEKEARAYVAKVEADLQANEWNITAAAPYPRGFAYTYEGERAKIKYNNYHALTKQDPKLGYQSSNGVRPVIVVMDEAKVERFVQGAKDDAAAQYDAFVRKLVAKVGDCDGATLQGSHVWGYSILTVTKGSTVERWKTQQIVNMSKLGKLFNQWPTRKAK